MTVFVAGGTGAIGNHAGPAPIAAGAPSPPWRGRQRKQSCSPTHVGIGRDHSSSHFDADEQKRHLATRDVTRWWRPAPVQIPAPTSHPHGLIDVDANVAIHRRSATALPPMMARHGPAHERTQRTTEPMLSSAVVANEASSDGTHRPVMQPRDRHRCCFASTGSCSRCPGPGACLDNAAARHTIAATQPTCWCRSCSCSGGRQPTRGRLMRPTRSAFARPVTTRCDTGAAHCVVSDSI